MRDVRTVSGMPAPARTLVIASDSGKGRSFSASLLAYIRADALDSGLSHKEFTRPAWMMYAGSEHEATPFTENLRTGRKGVLTDGSKTNGEPTTFECMRSLDYRFDPQRHPEGTVWQAYIPEFFRIDPGMVDPRGIGFVVAPEVNTDEWKAACAPAEVDPAIEHVRRIGYFSQKGMCDSWNGYPYPTPDEVRRLAPLSAFFAVYLARRTRAPLIPDARFYLQLMIEMMRTGQASQTPRETGYSRDNYFGEHKALGYFEVATDDVGLAKGIACKVSHDDLEKVLAEQVAVFVREVS